LISYHLDAGEANSEVRTPVGLADITSTEKAFLADFEPEGLILPAQADRPGNHGEPTFAA
jgi:hypothetical protein